MTRLTEEQVRAYRQLGFLVTTDLVAAEEISNLLQAAQEVAGMADGVLAPYAYTEQGVEQQLRQVENFCIAHSGLYEFACSEGLLGTASQLLAGPAVLFKDKINYKGPGGGGYAPHRDGHFWWHDANGIRRRGWSVYASEFVNALVYLDPATRANGALEVAPGQHRNEDLATECGPLSEHDAAALDFQLIPARPGDVVFFDANLRHRSGPNQTSLPRRALYFTYNKRAEGDHRARYFHDKRVSLQSGHSENR